MLQFKRKLTISEPHLIVLKNYMIQITEEEAKKYIKCQPSKLLRPYNWELTVHYFTSIPSIDPKYEGFDEITYYTNKLKK